MKLINKTFFVTVIGMFTAIIAVTVLVLFTYKPAEKNGFNRYFVSKNLNILHASKKITGFRTISGVQEGRIYFDTDTAGCIAEMDSNLSKKNTTRLKISFDARIQSLFTTFIDSSYCYIMAGNVPAVIQYNLHNDSNKIFHFPNYLYSQSVVIANNDYVFRAYQKSANKWNQVFVRINAATHSLLIEKNISRHTGDAGFSSDGILLFDKSTSRILYIEYFSNRVTCMDTLLQLIYTSHTIDTFFTATTRAALYGSGNSASITNGTPLHEVNMQSRAAYGKLFVHSAVQADNQPGEDFHKNSTIDTYTIAGGHYSGSFYIPEYKGQPLKEFDVFQNKIIVLYKDYVVTYANPFSL